MTGDIVLKYIWDNALEQRTGDGLSPLARVFTSLLAAPTISFVSSLGSQSFATYGGDEVMPGITLADVLDEEMGLEISEDTIVLIEPEAACTAAYVSSAELGRTLGELLLDLAKVGTVKNVSANAQRQVFGRKGADGALTVPLLVAESRAI